MLTFPTFEPAQTQSKESTARAEQPVREVVLAVAGGDDDVPPALSASSAHRAGVVAERPAVAYGGASHGFDELDEPEGSTFEDWFSVMMAPAHADPRCAHSLLIAP